MNRGSFLGVLFALSVSGWLLLSSGCASAAAQRGGDRDILTLEEIRESSASDVYRLIQALRPNWLQTRGAMTVSTVETEDGTTLANPEIAVYLDGSRLDSVSDLEGISTIGVVSVRRLNSREATQRFGSGHTRGAIVVSRQP